MRDLGGNEFHPTEMYDLINRMIVTEHPFEVKEILDTPQVIFFDYDGNVIGDAICHMGSYGHEKGLLEIMGLDIDEEEAGDSVIGYLTAKEVVDHYINALELLSGRA